MELRRPVAVFDAGIGSYAIVAEIQKAFPRQDILYLADRASFPYGSKSRAELLSIMRRTIAFLSTYDPCAIVVASNAPSIMVLDELREDAAIPLFGVFPPLQKALALSRTGQVGIMGVQSLVESPMLREFVGKHQCDPANVALINASSMVDLVEDGSFLFDPIGTQDRVTQFMSDLAREYPLIDVFTLSSTHLPWLNDFFSATQPNGIFLDPAKDIVSGLATGHEGSGIVRGLATETPRFDLKSLQAMLNAIGVDIPLETVTIG
ncbi:glutamate racemase [Pseudaminobacter soli (ex Li et al. 2025)]|uniref:Asp/Glu racemase n=1 Tax=Pseudaminobacter soli (ex Li et al. 2025) TaxID=1295366 RepID=A0A2P7SCM1_9HYPH|nr:aspartate/glutamate racemase family protein [Mesorhizobium soli]PSJ60236.1 Asp/Glu racemase [Mesorhizobium soli]